MIADDRTEAHFLQGSLFEQLKAELMDGLRCYWATAEEILRGSGILLLEAEPGYFSLEKNLFSALFLYSYARAGIPSERRGFYVAVNQCLRAMVTGCDNLLDDEYKQTLATDLPEKGIRFRSVLDIMVSDRVLFELLLNHCRDGIITYAQVTAVSRCSLCCLAKSGAQEASEEQGVGDILLPEEVLSRIHHFKTGLLFQAPWAAPEVLEIVPEGRITRLKDALYSIGMGCQILDDMVDLDKDLRERRHNYVASLIFHATEGSGKIELEKGMGAGRIFAFPDARRTASRKAMAYLQVGLRALFADEHQAATPFFLETIIQRIGAESYLLDTETEPS